MVSANTVQAQWVGTGNQSTNADVSIKTTNIQGSLTINRSDVICNIGGTTYTYPKPALSITQNRPFINLMNACGTFGSSATNNPQNIFEIMSSTYSNGSGGSYAGSFLGYNSPIFAIGEFGGMTVNGSPKPNFSNSIYGRNYLEGASLINGKLRLSNNAATIAAADFSNTNFPYTFSVDNGNSRFIGKVQIGATQADGIYSNYALSVDGEIVCKRVVVQIGSWADYVFKKDYKLMPLSELEIYLNKNNHLPRMRSESEIIESGLNVAEIQKMQQEKIEELTLYIIELSKRIKSLEDERKN